VESNSGADSSKNNGLGCGSPGAFLSVLSVLSSFERGNSFAFAGLACPLKSGKPLAWLRRLDGIISGFLEKGRKLQRTFSPVSLFLTTRPFSQTTKGVLV